MSFINRFSKITNGALTITGNTLGLDKKTNQNNPGTTGSIGAFITLDKNSKVNSYPPGTTLDYQKNSSSAILNLPSNCDVLYAELIWGGNYISLDENKSYLLNNPIILITPDNISHSIKPDIKTSSEDSLKSNDYDIGFYIRSSNVTSIIKKSGSGIYTCGSVLGLVEKKDALSKYTNHAGWTLIVAYKSSNMPFRNLSIYVGGEIISPDDDDDDDDDDDGIIKISNFITPSVGDVNGKLFFSAGEGDCQIQGDQVLFGPNKHSLKEISGPNNLSNNFFASQINNDKGILNTSGTFGDFNSNPKETFNTFCNRQGWDITAIDILNKLPNNCNFAIVKFKTNGDIYMPNLVALQLDINSPKLNVYKSTNTNIASIGDTLIYTIEIINKSHVIPNNVLFNDILSHNLNVELIPNTFKINDNLISNITNIRDITNISLEHLDFSYNKKNIITYKVKIIKLPTSHIISNKSNIKYNFIPIEHGSIKTSTVESNTCNTAVYSACLKVFEEVIPTTADIADSLTYIIFIKNEGNIKTENLNLIENIQKETTFIENSLFINGNNKIIKDLKEPYPLGDLNPNDELLIIFKVLVKSIPPSNLVNNQAQIDFEYRLDINSQFKNQSIKSNIVTTTIKSATLILEKTVDKDFAGVFDTLNYKIDIKNIGNVPALNVVLKDVLPKEVSFNPNINHVYLNGELLEGANPNLGIKLNHPVNYNQKYTLSFDVIILDSSLIQNFCTATYDYMVLDKVSKSSTSNTVSTKTQIPRLKILKAPSSTKTSIGNKLIYTITVKNTGKVNAHNLFFKDNTLLNYKNNIILYNLTIDEITYSDNLEGIFTGIFLGTINPNKTKTIKLYTFIISKPNPPIIKNTATISFKVPKVDESSIYYDYLSNNVEVIIDESKPILSKSVNVDTAFEESILTYSILVENTSDIPLLSLKLTDSLDKYLEFKEGTLNGTKINHVSNLNLSPLLPNENHTIIFKAKILKIPYNNYIIENICTLTGTIPTDNSKISFNIISNIVNTNVLLKEPKLNVIKSSSDTLTYVGKKLIYTILIKNIEERDASNIILKDDTLLDYKNNIILYGLTIDNVTYSNPYDIFTGIKLNTISPNETKTVKLYTLIISKPNLGLIENTAYIYQNETHISNSNTVKVTTDKSKPILTKSVDIDTAFEGSILTYTIVVENTTDIALLNLKLSDDLDKYLELISLNHEPVLDNNDLNLPLSNLEPNEKVTITFTAKVKNVPYNNYIIQNTSILNGSILENSLKSSSFVINSNLVTVKIKKLQMNIIKECNKLYAQNNDNLTFTINIDNPNELDATNVIIDDFLPKELSNSSTEFPYCIKLLKANSSHTKNFKAIVNSNISTSKTVNISKAIADFTLVSNKPIVKKLSVESNPVTINLIRPILNIEKYVNKNEALLGDTLTYYIKLENSGNITLNNILVINLLSEYVTFIEGTFKISDISKNNLKFNKNNILQNKYVPYLIYINNIYPKQTFNISFNVLVSKKPFNNKISNKAKLIFDYLVNPEDPPIVDKSLESNTVYTNILSPNIKVYKSVGKDYIDFNGKLTYTITIENTGNVNLINLKIKDEIPQGTSFVKNSLYLNEVQKQSTNLPYVISIPSLNAGNIFKITFSVNVISIKFDVIENSATVNYSYIINQKLYTDNINTNTVNTIFKNATIISNKYVDEVTSKVGKVLTYGVTLKNIGNIPANNVTFYDIFPKNLEYVPNSFVTSNISLKNQFDVSTFSKQRGFLIGSINPGETVFIYFKTKILNNTINPIINSSITKYNYSLNAKTLNSKTRLTISNSVETSISNNEPDIDLPPKPDESNNFISIKKFVNTNMAAPGDTLTYSIKLTNNTNATINSIWFKDSFDKNLVFVANTITMNSTPYYTLNPNIGFSIPSILANTTVSICFKAKIINNPESIAYNKATINYNEKKVSSNIVHTKITPNFLIIKKFCNKNLAHRNDILNFYILIENLSLNTAYNIKLIDNLSNNVELIPGTFIVNGNIFNSVNLKLGIFLGDLKPNNHLVIQFKTKFKYDSIPPLICNMAIIETFFKNDKSPTIFKSNMCTVLVGSIKFYKMLSKKFIYLN